jgi:hypothetical protein
MLNVKSLLIGVLSGTIILMSAYIFFQGQDYRSLTNSRPLSKKEVVGVLPNGKTLERYLIPYKGRIHYVYVTEDSTTINKKTINGKTTNIESETYLVERKK